MTRCMRPARPSKKRPARWRRCSVARQRGAQESAHPERRPEDRRRDRAQGAAGSGPADRHQCREDGSVIVGKILENANYSFGFDAQGGEYVDMVKKGIIDPTKVVRQALQGASSVAVSSSPEAMVAELPKKQNSMPPMPVAAAGWISKDIHSRRFLTSRSGDVKAKAREQSRAFVV